MAQLLANSSQAMEVIACLCACPVLMFYHLLPHQLLFRVGVGMSMVVSRLQSAWIWPLRCSMWVPGLQLMEQYLSMGVWMFLLAGCRICGTVPGHGDPWLGVQVLGLGSMGLCLCVGVLGLIWGFVCTS